MLLEAVVEEDMVQLMLESVDGVLPLVVAAVEVEPVQPVPPDLLANPVPPVTLVDPANPETPVPLVSLFNKLLQLLPAQSAQMDHLDLKDNPVLLETQVLMDNPDKTHSVVDLALLDLPDPLVMLVLQETTDNLVDLDNPELPDKEAHRLPDPKAHPDLLDNPEPLDNLDLVVVLALPVQLDPKDPPVPLALMDNPAQLVPPVTLDHLVEMEATAHALLVVVAVVVDSVLV